MAVKPNLSSLDAAITAVSDRWSLSVVRHLAFGPKRFTDLARATAAPRDVLTARLRSLEQDGVVERHPYGTGKRERYALTAKGFDLAEVVLVLKKWGDRHWSGEAAPVVLRHTVCGQPFEADVRCAACGNRLGENDLVEEPSPSSPGQSSTPGSEDPTLHP